MSTSDHGASNWLRDCRGWLRQPWLWWLVALLVSLGLLGDVRHTAKYFGCDLRSRTTGGRLLAAGIDPYSYFWQAGDPESFLDPEAYLAPHRPANRITVSPPVLISCLPIASFPWPAVRWCWLVVQWCLLAAAAALLVLATPRERRRLVLVVLLVGFVSGESWRFHVERGQAYVIYAAIWSAAAFCACRARWGWAGQIACGLLLGFAVGLRPTLIVALLPMGMARRGWLSAGGALGMALCFAVCLPLAGAATWQSYFRLQRDITCHRLNDTVPPHWRYLEEVPPSVEGVATRNLARDFGASGASLPLRIVSVAPRGWRYPLFQAGLALLTAGFCWRLWRLRCWTLSTATLLLAGTTLTMAGEFFIPATRNWYNNIVWMVPVALLLGWERVDEVVRGPAGWLLAISLVLANGVLPAGQYDLLRLSDYLLAGVMLWLSLRVAAVEAGSARVASSSS